MIRLRVIAAAGISLPGQCRRVRRNLSDTSRRRGVSAIGFTSALMTLLCFFSAPTAAQSDPSFFIMNSSTGDSQAKSISSTMANYLAIAIENKYPCSTQTTQSDVADLVDWERQRQLLGVGNEEALQNIAGAVGANYVGNIQVGQVGSDNYSVYVTIFDTKSAKAMARGSLRMKDESLSPEALKNLSAQVAKDLPVKPCRVTDWTGTVVVTDATNASGNDKEIGPFSGSSSLRMTCRLDGTSGNEAKCETTYSGQFSSRDGGWQTNGEGTVKCPISIFPGENRMAIRIHGCSKLKTQFSTELPLAGRVSTESEKQLGGWDVEGPSGRIESNISGGGQIDTMRITWELKPPPEN